VNIEGTAASFTADGQLSWAYDTQDSATSLVLTGQGTALVGGYYKNALTAIGHDGVGVWTFPFGGSVGSPVVSASGALLVPTSDGYLHALGP
jgi:outer membrane protein assembly factor BamB